MDAASRIEAVLFYKAAPVKKTELARLLSLSAAETEEALALLEAALAKRGVRLILTATEALLATAPECGELVNALAAAEKTRDIGNAGAETLAVIAYRGPLTRAEIERVRGVNSQFTLRTLLMRGLIQRQQNAQSRTVRYAATPALFAHLGICKREALPEYEAVGEAIDEYERTWHTA